MLQSVVTKLVGFGACSYAFACSLQILQNIAKISDLKENPGNEVGIAPKT